MGLDLLILVVDLAAVPEVVQLAVQGAGQVATLQHQILEHQDQLLAHLLNLEV